LRWFAEQEQEEEEKQWPYVLHKKHNNKSLGKSPKDDAGNI
jgi:hypothetical protein